MTYKVGDTVRIKEDSINSSFVVSFNESMKKMRGSFFTIDKIDTEQSETIYKINGWWFIESWIERLDKEKMSSKVEGVKCFITGKEELINATRLEEEVPISKEGLDIVNAFKTTVDNHNYGQKIGSKDKKGIIKSDRSFGVEFECGTTKSVNANVARCLVNPLHTWGSDGTIRFPIGTELKTCPLIGKEGEEELKCVADLMAAAKYKVNSSCGTHVHIGLPEAKTAYKSTKAEEVMEKKLRNLLLMYLTIDNAIVSLLPESRRVNSYCRRISRDVSDLFDYVARKPKDLFYARDRFDTAWFETNSITQAKEYKSNSYGGRTRYFGINMASMYTRGTLEIRYHEGTLDAERITHWIAFHSAIVDAVLDGTITEEQILKLGRLTKTKTVLSRLLTLIKKYISVKTHKAILSRYTEFDELNKEIDSQVTITRSEDDEDDDDYYDRYDEDEDDDY